MEKQTPGDELSRYWANFNGNTSPGTPVTIRSLKTSKIPDQTEAFLASGGKIQEIPRGVTGYVRTEGANTNHLYTPKGDK